ncbi:hypothetical protein NDU88_001822 [Pleurodeles waltl]|uniref:Uncharacterized protein n=1 Tax=Pleurodeles waltl TaxID=8319 RepID=A0AAV7KTN1_PLEWA|nr:hypothetical protein NDU88_001822 [Pleurodeles waltl]
MCVHFERGGVDSCVVIAWAYFCWRDGGGFVFASFSLTFGVADLCGCLNFVGFRDVGRNSCGGIPRLLRCVGGRLHGVYPSEMCLTKQFLIQKDLQHQLELCLHQLDCDLEVAYQLHLIAELQAALREYTALGDHKYLHLYQYDIAQA